MKQFNSFDPQEKGNKEVEFDEELFEEVFGLSKKDEEEDTGRTLPDWAEW